MTIPKQTKIKEKYSETKIQRYDVGYAILRLMEKNDDLPLPNITMLAKTMQEYYKMYNGEDAMLDIDGKWRPSIKYWTQNINRISCFIAEQYKKYFAFLRNDGLKGIWKFMNKDEFEKHLKFYNQDISTRVESQNEKIDLAENKWEIDVPKIKEVPRLGM